MPSEVPSKDAPAPTANNAASEESSKPDSSEAQAKLQKKVPAQRKKRFVERNNALDNAIDRAIVIHSHVGIVRKQQLRVIKAIKAHHNSLKTFLDFSDDRVHMMIEEYIKPKSDLTPLILPEEERKQYLKKPEPYQPEGVIDPDAFHFGFTVNLYEKFIKEQEEAAGKSTIRALYKKEQKPFLRMPDMSKCWMKKCAGCGCDMYNCHDVVYDLYCVFGVVNACTEEQDLISKTTVKKIFWIPTTAA